MCHYTVAECLREGFISTRRLIHPKGQPFRKGHQKKLFKDQKQIQFQIKKQLFRYQKKFRIKNNFASQKCQQSQGSEGSWSQNAELSSLLDSRRVFASQKCQQSQGSEPPPIYPNNLTFKAFLLYTPFKPFRPPFTDIK